METIGSPKYKASKSTVGKPSDIEERTKTRKVSPETFKENAVFDNRNYSTLIRKAMDYVNIDNGLEVILTPGRYNSAYFEHSYLAEKAGVILAFADDLIVENDTVYYKGLFDKRERVGVIYRRISDEYLDPLAFESSSLLGVPNLMRAYAKGNVAIMKRNWFFSFAIGRVKSVLSNDFT